MTTSATSRFTTWLFGAYFCLLILYAVFSYSLTDPNLVLSSWAPYWSFQQWMWYTFFQDAPLLTNGFIVLVTALFGVYFFLAKHLTARVTQATHSTARGHHQPWLSLSWWQPLILGYLVLLLPLILSYNMLSHDVFNYIFNAKMVVVYHANPHQKVALDFAFDNWTRFMHNTHTPAPYGYGWTAFSVLPYVLGLNKFLFTWFIFRLLSVVSIGLLFVTLLFFGHQTGEMTKDTFWEGMILLFLNPLFLIELVSDSHNDLWMMVPAMAAIALLFSLRHTRKKWLVIAASITLLGFSISVKLATALLIPVWLFFVLYQLHVWGQVHNWFLKHHRFAAEKLSTGVELVQTWWPVICIILLSLPLLTNRSQQFNPWYLTWLLVWLPFTKSKWLRTILVVFSFSSLMRYIPWLWNGGYSDFIIFQQKVITWSIPTMYIIISGVYLFFTHQRSQRSRVHVNSKSR